MAPSTGIAVNMADLIALALLTGFSASIIIVLTHKE
jgi:hypothetical protein